MCCGTLRAFDSLRTEPSAQFSRPFWQPAVPSLSWRPTLGLLKVLQHLLLNPECLPAQPLKSKQGSGFLLPAPRSLIFLPRTSPFCVSLQAWGFLTLGLYLCIGDSVLSFSFGGGGPALFPAQFPIPGFQDGREIVFSPPAPATSVTAAPHSCPSLCPRG